MPKRLASSAERFVGRSHELHRVDRACTAAAHGQGSLTVVSGPPGIGKTSFCEEVAARAGEAGLTVVTARCWGESGAPPLWPWQPILAELGGDGAAELLASEAGPDPADRDRDPDRFARFTAVTDRLADACALAPVCLIVDDVDAADVGTLLLFRFVARSLPRLPLALVLSRRSDELDPVGAAAPAGKAEVLDDIEREATPIVLAGFDLDETAAFLAGHGFADLDAEAVLALHRVTAGNPLFLRRVAALGKPGPADSLPGGLQMAIEQALARLGPETQRILRTTAVLLEPAGVAVAAAVAETDAASVVDAVREASPAGLVALDGDGRYVFGHELIRLAIEATLTGAERLDAHARAAHVVVGDGAIPTECLGRRAHHALVAAARSEADARWAVAMCETAADAMVASSAYEQADILLSAAVGLYESPDLGSPAARLLVRWAQAAHRCGRLSEARERFDQAAAAAQDSGDPALYAEAVLGLGGHWVNEYRTPVERARVLGLQRAALAGLPGHHTGLRCQLEMRLAAEAVLDGEPDAALDPVHAALDAARRSGDPLALAEALSLCHNVLFTPEHTDGRLALADEQVRIASESGYGVLGLMGLCWRAADLFCTGDERAHAALADLRERANALASRHIVYMVGVMDVMLLLRAGRLDEAEAEAARCHELGSAIGEVDAFGYFSGQIFAIRWIQGRDTELLDLADAVATSPTLHRANFAFQAAVASFTARAGHPEQARAQLDGLLTGGPAGGLAGLPQSSTWLAGMAAIADVATTLGDAALAREAYDLLLPYAHLPTMGSLAVLCLGSTERVLGCAALAFGDADRAAGHLRRAVAENRRLGHRPMVAIAQADLARALVRRDRAGDRASDLAEAAGLLDAALAEAGALGLDARAAVWRDERAALSRSGDQDPPPAEAEGAPRQGVIRRDGSRWLVALDGQRVRVGDLVGMSYLAELLLRPGQVIPALALASQGAAPREGGRHELLDDEARAAYAARAQELTADLAEAEADNDIGRAEQLRIELDTLIEQLEAATGLSGRPRNFTDPTERARTAVRKAIKRAVDVVDDANPAIAEVLRTCVTTGTTCTYAPDPRHPVVWSTTEPIESADPPRSGPGISRSDEISSAQNGVPTIGGRLHSVRQRWFVGREDEIRLVRSALAADDPAFSVLFVHGPGGVGKTALLGAFASEAGGAGVRSIRLDMHTIEPTPSAFVERFAAGLGWEPGDVTLDSLAGCGRVLVLIDTLELAAPLDTWLRETFIVHLPSDALVVIAGRHPPSPQWLADAAWRGLSRVAPLGDLPPVDARRYLALRGIEEPAHDRLVALTHGHPLALSLVADVLDQRPPGDRGDVDLADAPDVVRMLMERFVGEVPDSRHREALTICAHVRYTTEDLLRGAMGGDDAGDLLAWLRSRSFVEEGRDGLFPHDLARDVLDTELRWRDRVAYEDLHRRIRAHICDRIRASRGLARQRAAADLLYLHRSNPVMRPLFDWRQLGQVRVDRPAATDHDRIVAMTERHQGPVQAGLVRHWLDRQPAAFVVFRRSERDIAGFTAFLRLHEASPEDIAGDPGTRALWAYATRHDPPRRGEVVTATRFLVDAEADQAQPSASWTGFAVAHILHTMETDRLAWDFIAAFRSLDVEPVFAYIDHPRVPGAEFTVGDVHHPVFAHDWRRLGWEAFVDMMGDRELDDGAGMAAPSAFVRPGAPVLSEPEFADAVRAALRDRHRPDRLEDNPLARSRAVRDRFGADPGPAALARLLDETAGALADDPRDAKAHRAVDRTYLHPAPTQERAAELLDLPFSTYRRHLARGIERITSQLWDLELSAPGPGQGSGSDRSGR